ncbi:MAG: nicotinate-nicotinamide nucleotide adenylyltransferase [Proteobacteria bacterium]|nr:MAG: nicotinate-nicotinamide nucleotide adenylyltransferase [Pseudomonadota bacterium]QKK10637.1 MAG: nicotinate-nicotinamide nucleotide adenylyltransferase [Pseudomonadota bacterium]
MRILTIGGTFNPIHIGHIRLAVEASEALGFDRIEWIPCFSPGHKKATDLLPYALRVELVRLATHDLYGSVVNDIESRLPTPSFTYQTLSALATAESCAERFFVVGQDEFCRLHLWYRGRYLVSLAHLLITGNSGAGPTAFHETLDRFWPDSRQTDPPPSLPAAYEFRSGRRALFLPLPYLEIRSSLVRKRWLAGRDLRHLLPTGVLDELISHRSLVSETWRQALASA